MRTLGRIALVVLLVPSPAPLRAQAPGASRSVEMVAENDLFALRGGGLPPDYDYTHGTRAGVTWSHAPRWAARMLRAEQSCRPAIARVAGCATTTLRLAQDIYTPRRDAPLPVPGERPYAGLLSLAAAVERVRPGALRALALEVGTTGRASLAEDMQSDVHRLVESGPQLGWRHQLPARAAVALRWSELRRWERPTGTRSFAAARLRWDAVAGNALILGSSGADLTLGVRGDGGWSPAAPNETHPARLYLRLGAREDAVARSVLVEGWRRGSAARRRPFVAEGEAALGARWRRYATEYRQVLRGAEYRAEPSPHPYGSVRLVIDGY